MVSAALIGAGLMAQEPSPSTLPTSIAAVFAASVPAPVGSDTPPGTPQERDVAAGALIGDDDENATWAAPARLTIPSLEVETELETLGIAADRSLEVPADPARAGWFTGSSAPGEPGPAVIAGHVTWNGEPAVFLRLADLRPGDPILLADTDGQVTRYVVTELERVDKGSFPTARVYGDTEEPVLRLITCGGAYDEASGNYQDNVIVYATIDPVQGVQVAA